MSIDQLRNQMVGEPTRVPGFAEGYGQAPGQARPSMPPQPNPIGRPSLVVGGPAYYTPPGFQAPPQPTEAFLPTDVRPDPIGQQFMRQMESPMGQQFIEQYEATQAPLRQARRKRQQAELARRDERFQELMSRISELEGQLGSQEEAPVMPNVPTFPIGDDFEIDFSQIPGFDNFLNFNKQMEPFEREDYQDLMSEINNLPSPPSIDSILAAEQEKADRGIIGRDFADFSTQGPSMPIPGSEIDLSKYSESAQRKARRALEAGMPVFEGPRVGSLIGPSEDRLPPLLVEPPMPGTEIDLSKLDQSVAEKIKRSLAAGMPVFQRDNKIIGPSEDRLPPMPMAPQMPKLGGFAGAIPMPGQEQGVNTSTIPKGMRFMGQPLIPTSTPPRKGSFLSAIRRPDLDQQQNISGPFGFAGKLNKGPGI